MSDLYNKASLVMTPQLVDTGKVYSIKPENRRGDFDFTRASAATRVGADGNIEKETSNLLLQSNSFDTTWTKDSGITLTSGATLGGRGPASVPCRSRRASPYRRQPGLLDCGEV